MEKELAELEFNINKQMTDYVVEIMKIKEKIANLEKDSNEYHQEYERIVKMRKKFIKEFQSINQDEINDYFRIKNKS